MTFLKTSILGIVFACVSFSSTGQNTGVQITYKTVEIDPTLGEMPTGNLSNPPNFDSLLKMYDPKAVGAQPIKVATLQASRQLNGIIYKRKMGVDTLFSEFDTKTKLNTSILRFASKAGDSSETIRIALSYQLPENEFYSYAYKIEQTGNRKQILNYPCEQVMITETVTNKFDNSQQEYHTNAWITDKIAPSISLQSILLIHSDILPNFTLLEATRSPYGQPPHRIVASEIVYGDIRALILLNKND